MKRVYEFFFPKDKVFFKSLYAAADNALEASRELQRFLKDYDRLSPEQRVERAKRIHLLEDKGDLMTHSLVQKLHSTFMTPFDREDIHELAVLLDDFVDLIDSLATKLSYYDLDSVSEAMKLQSRLALEQITEIDKALRKLEGMHPVSKEKQRVLALEDEADDVHRKAMSELFRSSKNGVRVLKFKELLDRLEALTDKGQRIAWVLDGIVVKHA